MRFPVVCAWLAVALFAPLHARSARSVTVVIDFPDRSAPELLPYIAGESAQLLRDQDLTLDWRNKSGVIANETFSDVVMVRLKGSCAINPVPEPFLPDERGPYAWTYITDGVVLPFSDVSCDRVRKNIKTVMHGGDYKHANEIMGRALARVIVHELMHMIHENGHHELTGVMRHALRPDDLISEHLKLEFGPKL